MAINWNEEAEGSPKLHEGYHRVTIDKVVRSKKDGTLLENRDGVPMMIVVVKNEDGAEASGNYTIDKSKKFFLAKLIVATGTQDQFDEVEDFEDADNAKKLEGIRLWVRVTHNGQYANFEPLEEKDVPVDVIQKAKREHAEGKKQSAKPAAVPAGGVDDDEDDSIPF